MRAYIYQSTGEAYDATQVGEAVDGDILIIASEKVVGVSYTWPFALSANHGSLHSLSVPLWEFISGIENREQKLALTLGAEEAVRLVEQLGW